MTGPCVVDTSAWIEWLVDSPLGQLIGTQLPAPANLIVPTIVQLELAKWLNRERDEDVADRVTAYTLKCRIAPLTTAIALLAAEQHRLHKLATADAIVYGTALSNGAGLLTCDAHFEGLAGVVFLQKA